MLVCVDEIYATLRLCYVLFLRGAAQSSCHVMYTAQLYRYVECLVIILYSFSKMLAQGGEAGQTPCSERSKLQRTERATASEASESSPKKTVMYLKLDTKTKRKQ